MSTEGGGGYILEDVSWEVVPRETLPVHVPPPFFLRLSWVTIYSSIPRVFPPPHVSLLFDLYTRGPYPLP